MMVVVVVVLFCCLVVSCEDFVVGSVGLSLWDSVVESGWHSGDELGNGFLIDYVMTLD